MLKTLQYKCSGYDMYESCRENSGRQFVVLEVSEFLLKTRENSGNRLKNPNCRDSLQLFFSIIDNVCHGIHRYERAHVILYEIDFVMFSSVTLAEL